MMPTKSVLSAIYGALFAATLLVGQEEDAVRRELIRADASPLHQMVIASNGRSTVTGHANRANLYSSIDELAQASDDVILGHIESNSTELCPNGTAPMTVYKVGIVRVYKGIYTTPTLYVTLPTGSVNFSDGLRAFAVVQDFIPLQNGGRYLLFLRAARGEERQTTPGLRLTGDGVQGAFLLDDETVVPNFRGDSLWKAYFKVPVAGVLSHFKTEMSPGGVEQFDTVTADGLACCEITEQALKSAGFRLPSYMPTIRSFRRYAMGVIDSCDIITMSWDSLPGRAEQMREEDVRGVPLSGDFLITSRNRRPNCVPGTGDLDVNQHRLVFVGITPANQIRALVTMADPRIETGESLEPGNTYSSVFVTPKVTMTIGFPDDPAMKTIVILQPYLGAERWELRKIGSVAAARGQGQQ